MSKQQGQVKYIGVGIAIGAGAGVALNNIPVGIALGVVLGVILSRVKAKKDDGESSE